MFRSIVMALFGLILVGCGELSTQYSCACSRSCDNSTAAVVVQICATESEAQKAVDDGVAKCVDDVRGECDSATCACACEPTSQSC